MIVKNSLWFSICLTLTCVLAQAEAIPGYTFRQWAEEITAQIETDYRLTGFQNRNLYAESMTQRFSAYAWPQGIMFGALAAAAKVDPSYLETASSMADAFQNRYRCYARGYWAYNASAGNCGDRYYDDNAWIALVYMELYELTGSPDYLNRAREILVFCMSGENGPGDTYPGGIRWHEFDTGGVSICSTAPTCLANLMVYQATGIEQYLIDGARLYHFLEAASYLRYSSGIYHEINQGSLGYLTAVVIQSAVRLYRITADTSYLTEAQRLAAAMEPEFLNANTLSNNQTGKWGGHDMTNAYVELYEVDGNPYWLNLAAGYLNFLYLNGKDPVTGRFPERWNNTSRTPSSSLIDNASVARAFWKMAGVPSATPRTHLNIRNRTSGRALRPLSAATMDNTTLVIFNANTGDAAQLWSLSDLGNGYYNIRNRHSGKSIQPFNNLSADNTAAVIMTTEARAYAQQWKLIDVGGGYFNIQNRLTGKSLQTLNSGTTHNTAVILTTTNLDQQSQQWQLVGPSVPTSITPSLSINDGRWLQTNRAILEPGDTLALKGEVQGADGGGTWKWTMPDGAIINSNQYVISDFQLDRAGRYFVSYTNPNGITSHTAVDVSSPVALSLYQHIDYMGWVAQFGVGAYRLADLIAAGGRNNDASSLKIAPGYTVTFYSQDNFQGAWLVKTGDVVSLVSDGWNDRVSSFIVEGSPGPLGHWPFNEQTGVIAGDASGQGRHAQFVNMDESNWVAGKRCGGLSFNGTTNYLTIPGFKGVSGAKSRTCSAWIKTTSDQQNYVLSWGEAQLGRNWMFGLVNGRYGVRLSGGYVQTRRTLNDGQWHHVALVVPDTDIVTPSHIKLYVNGVLEEDVEVFNTTINIATSSANDVIIGARFAPGHPDVFFDGLIDKVQIYDSALSHTRIWELYAADALVGDILSDGVVDVLDFVRLAEAWQTSDPKADLNCDGIVDLADFAVLAEEWLRTL